MSETSPVRASVRSKALLGVELRDPTWFRGVRVPVAPGKRTDRLLTVPQADAQALLRSVIRRVADLPVGAKPRVVWTDDRSELLVHTNTVSLACSSGLVTISIRVECDQTPAVSVAVPIAVGTRARPAGLVMQAFSHVDAPPIIARQWSEALTAFAWEALVETARAICGQVGKDAAGRPLVPGSIGAASRMLLLQPMARHDLGKVTP